MVMRRWSLAVTRIIGPGTVPSRVQASTRFIPFTGSHMTCCAVNVKCLAPSGSTLDFANWPPYSCVALGTPVGALFVSDVLLIDVESAPELELALVLVLLGLETIV